MNLKRVVLENSIGALVVMTWKVMCITFPTYLKHNVFIEELNLNSEHKKLHISVSVQQFESRRSVSQ